jgi:hypothetical protein
MKSAALLIAAAEATNIIKSSRDLFGLDGAPTLLIYSFLKAY